MNLQQQTQNVAAQGRYGDTMLMHVNPAEVAGLSQVMPLTINPETGQPEAFLPMLLPLLGSIGGTALAGTAGLSGAVLGAIGSGLGTWAATGDIKKGILGGLTGYGLGKVFSAGKTAADAAGATAATQGATNAATQGVTEAIQNQALSTPVTNAATQSVTESIANQGLSSATAGTTAGAGAGSSLTAGLGAAGKELMKPGTMIPLSLGLGGQGIMQSQEEFQRSMENLKNENLDEYNRILAEHPEYVPMLQQNQTFAKGGKVKKEFKPVAAIQARDIDPYFMAGLQGERGYLKNVNPSSGQIISGKTGYDFGTEMADAPMSAPFNPTQTVGYQSFYNAPREPYVLDPYVKQTFEAPPAPVAPPVRPPSELEKVAESAPISTLPVPPPEESKVLPFNPADYMNEESLNMLANTFASGLSREAKEELDTGVPMQGMMDVTAPPPRSAPTPASAPSALDNYNAYLGGQGNMMAGLSREEINSGAFDPSMLAPPPAPPPQSFAYASPEPIGRGQDRDIGNNEEYNRFRSDTDDILSPPLRVTGDALNNRRRTGGGRNKKAEGGKTDLPNKGLEALNKVAPNAVNAMGYQEGGMTESMLSDPIVQDAINFITGQSDDDSIVDKFLGKYGSEAYLELRNLVLKQAAQNDEVITEGLISGEGGGMDDLIDGVIGNQEKVAVSQDEFIIPADVVSQLGDGSSNAGSDKLYAMMDRVRKNKTGTMQQASKLPQGMMPA